MLTTICTDGIIDSDKVNFAPHGKLHKPNCHGLQYINVWLVDKCDMMIGALECAGKTVEVDQKFIFSPFRCNSAELFQHAFGGSCLITPICTFILLCWHNCEVWLGKQCCDKEFLRQQGLVLLWADWVTKTLHKLGYMPSMGTCDKGKRVCAVCKHMKRREEAKMCVCSWSVECKVVLYTFDCFSDYHTHKVQYWFCCFV